MSAIRTLRDLSTGFFALEGSEYINDTEEHIGNFYRFHAYEDSVIDHIEAQNLTGNDLDGATIVAKDNLDCQFFTIKLTSGRGIAHKLSQFLPPGVFSAAFSSGQLTYTFGSRSFTWPMVGAAIADISFDANLLQIEVADGIAHLTGGGLNHTFPVSGTNPNGVSGPFQPHFAAGLATFRLEITKSFSFPVS